MLLALATVIIVLVVGTAGYYLVGDGQWSLDDCLYMTLITYSTVGFSEAIDITSNPAARNFTMGLIVASMASWAYFFISATAFLVEGELGKILWRNKMIKRIDGMSDHLIVCGAGQTGFHAISEMKTVGEHVVAIEHDEARLKKLEALDVPYVEGDATDDDVLLSAGLKRARGLVASLSDDMSNLFVTITARQQNPSMRIVSRAVLTKSVDKLEQAGADAVVVANRIGGMRMASEMIRPMVVSFIDEMLRSPGSALRLDEVAVTSDSPFVGSALRESDIRSKADVLVVAVRRPETGEFLYNPRPDHVLKAGEILVVLGRVEDVRKLRD